MSNFIALVDALPLIVAKAHIIIILDINMQGWVMVLG